MLLSLHFSEENLNVCNCEQRVVGNATTLCTKLLEPIWEKFGELEITSGYRPTGLNHNVGGVSTSFHLYENGKCAADFVPKSASIKQVFDWIRMGSKLNFDKVIMEHDYHTLEPACIHIQYDCCALSRRQAFEGFTHGKSSHYNEVAVI